MLLLIRDGIKQGKEMGHAHVLAADAIGLMVNDALFHLPMFYVVYVFGGVVVGGIVYQEFSGFTCVHGIRMLLCYHCAANTEISMSASRTVRSQIACSNCMDA